MNNDEEKQWPLFRSFQGVGLGGFHFDLVAGLTLAAIAIPTQMATARLGGFRARYRLFRLYRGIDRLRGVWLEPLSLGGRGFHDHADLRGLAGVAGSRWRGGLLRTRRDPCFAGRLDFGAGRRVSGGLGGRSSVHSGRDGVSRGHRHPYRDLASAGAARLARRRGRGVSPPGADRPRHRQNQLPDAGDRRILSRVHRPVRKNQPAHSRRADRAGRRDFRRRAF